MSTPYDITDYPPFAVTDNRIAAVATSSAPAALSPGRSFTGTGTYTIAQPDLDAGEVVNTASASALDGNAAPVASNTDSKTVTALQSRSLVLEKTAVQASYAAVGDTINLGLGGPAVLFELGFNPAARDDEPGVSGGLERCALQS